MNVSVENLAPCRKLLRIEIDAKAVDEAFDAVLNEFRKEANLPGFRPGKAPRDMVAKRYEKEIADEVGMKHVTHLHIFLKKRCQRTPKQMLRQFRGD